MKTPRTIPATPRLDRPVYLLIGTPASGLGPTTIPRTGTPGSSRTRSKVVASSGWATVSPGARGWR